ncbi:MAG: V-type ATP synthase subunit D [Anaerolineales bacterium]|jgi:V/A-type H+-transporting ATPase subunit D
MAKVSPTRQALLERKSRIELAQQGRDLLEKKRAALMEEILRAAQAVMHEADELRQAASQARRALARAETVAGPAAVRSAALAARGEVPIEVTIVNVMGVRIPELEQRRVSRTKLERGYAPAGTSVTIDEAASAFEGEVDAIIDLAESELRLRRLTDEIQSTSRRLNALDEVMIPRLERERDSIELALSERERAEHFRLMRAKKMFERRREQSK